ncbi:hypothetical protein ACWEOV_23755 [Streptomyces sp. NPDC004365]
MAARDDALEQYPEAINSDPSEQGWLLDIEVDLSKVSAELATPQEPADYARNRQLTSTQPDPRLGSAPRRLEECQVVLSTLLTVRLSGTAVEECDRFEYASRRSRCRTPQC